MNPKHPITNQEITMTRSLVASLVAAVALMGCGSGSTGEVKLGVDVAALRTTVASANEAEATDPELVLTRVRVLVAHAKIGYIGEKATGPAADIGPFVVDLTADEIANGAHREFSLGEIPADTYGGAEIEIEPLDDDATSTDPALDDFRAAKASLLVEGTYQGQPFAFAGHFLAEQGTDGEVVVDASAPAALAMTVDPSSWFLDASGVAVDPADAAQHDTLAVAICETLDTQPQTDMSSGGGAPPADSSAPASGGKHGHGGKGGGGGHGEHCVEQAP
jgi:hypothetical protein